MVRIKNLVVLGFFAVLVHDLHAQAATVGTIRCLPPTYNYDFANQANGLPAPTAVRTNTITITATGTVTLRVKGTLAASNPSPTITGGGIAAGSAPTSWAAWGTTGIPVVAGTYRLIITAPNPGAGAMDPYYWVAGISDPSGGCVEGSVYGRIGAGSGTTNFGTAPTQAQLDQLTTCVAVSGGAGINAGPIAGPWAGNSPPNNKDRFTVLLNTGGRGLVVGQIQGNNFTSFGGLGTFNARHIRRDLRGGNMLRLMYVPMIPTSTPSGSSCCLSGLTRGSNNSNGGSGKRAVAVRSRVSRGSGRVSHRR
jgi:hypothetical protein